MAVTCVAIATLFFGFIPVFLRHFKNLGLDAWTINGFRYSVSAAFWLPYVIYMSRRGPKTVGPAPAGTSGNLWRDAMIPAAINVGGQIGWALCPYYNNAATVGFGIRLSFLFTALFGFIFLRAERPLARKPWFLMGAAACIVGMVLLYAERMSREGVKSLGGLGVIAATAAWWGAYAISVRHWLRGYPLRKAFGVISLYTVGPLLVLAVTKGDYGQLADQTLTTHGMIILSGLLGITFGHVLFYRGIHSLGPVVASGITLAGPVVTFICAEIFLSEPAVGGAIFAGMTASRILGGMIIIAGGACLLKAQAQLKPPP